MANTASTYDRNALYKADHGKIDFVKIAPIMGGISVLLTILAIALLLTKGLNYGIDFAGGTEIQLRFPQAVDAHQLREAIEGLGIHEPSVQSFGANNEFLIRLETPRERGGAAAILGLHLL